MSLGLIRHARSSSGWFASGGAFWAGGAREPLRKFDQGNILTKVGILVVLLAFVAAYFAGVIIIYRRCVT
jgi:hypothetical protein